MYKILLVEDDEIISKSIMQHLENWDFEVITARDFKNITNEFTECNAHIVLLDLILLKAANDDKGDSVLFHSSFDKIISFITT